MIAKDELLNFLKKGLNTEEKAIPLYAKYLNSTFFLSDFKPEDQVRIKEVLMLLKKESEFHARAFENLIRTVERSDKNVY